MDNEAPLISNWEDITQENCPEMYAELCDGCADEECADHE